LTAVFGAAGFAVFAADGVLALAGAALALGAGFFCESGDFGGLAI
jgi:hypothetical protein